MRKPKSKKAVFFASKNVLLYAKNALTEARLFQLCCAAL